VKIANDSFRKKRKGAIAALATNALADEKSRIDRGGQEVLGASPSC
jgi:hypothetical protein